MAYTNQHLCAMFNISHQTAKNWAKEFAPFLSPAANPGENRQRVYNMDDLRVFSLVYESRNAGKHYDEIRVALANGSRGDIPQFEADSLAPAGVKNREIAILQAQVADLERQVDNARMSSAVDRALREKAERELETAKAEIARLNREIGRLEASKD
jgi:DNA-binding transcriptional MerR regulator